MGEPVEKQFFVFTIYVAGMNNRSLKALENLRNTCDEHLKGRYEIKVVDLNQKSGWENRKNIVVVPTIFKELPMPVRQIVGDISAEQMKIDLDIL